MFGRHRPDNLNTEQKANFFTSEELKGRRDAFFIAAGQGLLSDWDIKLSRAQVTGEPQQLGSYTIYPDGSWVEVK